MPQGASTSDDDEIPPDSLSIPFSLPAPGQDRLTMLSGYLHTTLPHRSIAALILNHGKSSIPIKRISPSPLNGEAQLDLLSPTAHPIHFARKLIQLAICLQELDATTSEQPLNEPARDTARRYFDIASRHVTSQDLLVDSLDGLETLMLEAIYHISVGNLRAAWLVFRRALSIGQLIGLAENRSHRLDLTWFRLIYSDRFLSLMLGLPAAVADNTFTLAADEPFERLERNHVVVVGRIIARNLRMQRHEDAAYDDYKETQDIDYNLKRAARLLPARWWMLPNLGDVAPDADTMEKLNAQMHHHHLLVVLHQPYLIQKHPKSTTGSAAPSIDYTYSKLAVLSASREVLSRYLEFRNFHHIPAYRGVEPKAFTPSITLLIGHIESHRLGHANVLEHQRPHDLSITDNVIGCMERTAHFNEDVSSSSSAQLLKELMKIEADAADGAVHSVWMEEGTDLTNGEHSLRLPMPYFGTICIARQRASLDSDSVPMAEPALGPSTAAEHSILGDTNEDIFLTMDFQENGGTVSSESQLQAAVELEENLMFQSALRSIQEVSQPPTNILQEIQDCSYEEVDTACIGTWLQEEAQSPWS